MRKSSKGLLAALALLFAAPLAAADFDWSQVWCNYGGGIEKGDIIVNIDGGLWLDDGLFWLNNDGGFFFPPVMAELQFAVPVWKLPFTFGGYAGFRANGHGVLFTGAEAAYHVMLPPKGLDVYVSTKIGLSIPFVNNPPHTWNWFNWGEAIGASWYFSDFFGLNLEFGYPMSKFGVSLKF